MVCGRCTILLMERLEAHHLPVERVDLGTVSFTRNLSGEELTQLDTLLAELDLSRIQNKRSQLVERIKALALDWAQGGFRRSPYTFSVHLAEKLDMDYSYLTHLFSQEAGQTLEQHLIKLKTELAKDLLRDPELSFTQVAERLGYSSLAHFSTQFKKTTGQTPSAFRLAPQGLRALDRVSR